jgi:hypothetical protein
VTNSGGDFTSESNTEVFFLLFSYSLHFLLDEWNVVALFLYDRTGVK